MRKSLVALIAFWFILLPPARSQEGAKLKNIEVSWGDSAFTSGLNLSLLFSLNDKKDVQLVGNSERFYATLNYKIHEKLSLDVTGGSFKKVPWAGPRITYYPVKPVMIMYWGGWSAGRVGDLKPELKSFCQQFSAYATPEKHISIGYTVIKYDVYKTDHLPEVAYYYWLKKDLRLGASVTYDVVAKKPLFCMSLMFDATKKK